jgi:hypothetical protein
MSAPLNVICPRVGVRNFVRRLNTVVLPAPLGPIKAWIVPSLTDRVTSFTARKPRNSMVSPVARRMGCVLTIGFGRYSLDEAMAGSGIMPGAAISGQQ